MDSPRKGAPSVSLTAGRSVVMRGFGIKPISMACLTDIPWIGELGPQEASGGGIMGVTNLPSPAVLIAAVWMTGTCPRASLDITLQM